jgi:hypothetical protein
VNYYSHALAGLGKTFSSLRLAKASYIENHSMVHGFPPSPDF